MHLWDKTIPQAELTLNLMRGSRINPKLSAYEQIYGRYDHNKVPLAPPGIKVLAHIKPDQRLTWAPHAVEGWYVGPAFDHYRCYTIWVIPTRQTRTVNQLEWFPQKLAMPVASQLDLIGAGATLRDLSYLLKAKPIQHLLNSRPPSERDLLLESSIMLQQALPPVSKTKSNLSSQARPCAISKGGPRATWNPSIKSPPGAASAPQQAPTRYTPGEAYLSVNSQSLYEASLSFLPSISEPFPLQAWAWAAINPDTGLPAEYRELIKSSGAPRWILGMSKELGRLFQGYKSIDGLHDTEGTQTCRFIHRKDMPADKKATYVRVVTMFREQKADPYRIRMTVGGNLIEFPGDKSTKTADIIAIKALINSIISTPGARAAAIDLKNFYLENDLPNKEYIRIPLLYIPTDIQEQYNLQEYIVDGHVYAEISKGMYGLPQAGKVASDFLIPRLAAAGYHETGVIPGLFKHESNSVTFALVVDDFLFLSSTQTRRTWTTSRTLSTKIMSAPLMKKPKNLLESLSIGTMNKVMWMHPCQAILKKQCSDSLTPFPKSLKQHPASGLHPITVPVSNMPNPKMKPITLTNPESPVSKKSLESFCTTPELWITPC